MDYLPLGHIYVNAIKMLTLGAFKTFAIPGAHIVYFFVSIIQAYAEL